MAVSRYLYLFEMSNAFIQRQHHYALVTVMSEIGSVYECHDGLQAVVSGVLKTSDVCSMFVMVS